MLSAIAAELILTALKGGGKGVIVGSGVGGRVAVGAGGRVGVAAGPSEHAVSTTAHTVRHMITNFLLMKFS
jgi:hypothetical protein